MKPITAQELADALPKCSPQAQLEIQNAILVARLEEYEASEKAPEDDTQE
jgi:hypothetical protein